MSSGAFTRRLNHDLQAVFHSVEGFASAVIESAAQRLTEREAAYLVRIRRNAERGGELLRGMTTLLKLADEPVALEDVDLGVLVREVIDAQRAESGFGGRNLQWRVSDLPHVRGDRSQLLVAISQLIGNAVKFTSPVANAFIQIEAVREGAQWRIVVRDNGVGFDPAYADRLFQPLERLHPVNEFAGAGFGLACVALIALRLGGSVRAKGEVGKGAEFSISLDAASAQAQPEPSRADTGACLRILAVDDDPMVLLTVQSLLRRDGHEVACAQGGSAALKTIRDTAVAGDFFDLVVTDAAMPHVDGFGVALAAKEVSRATKVLILTGGSTQPVPSACAGLVDGFVAKPLRLGELRSAIEKVFADE